MLCYFKGAPPLSHLRRQHELVEDIGNIIQPVEDIFVLNFSTVLKRAPGQSVPQLSEYSQRIITGAFSHTFPLSTAARSTSWYIQDIKTSHQPSCISGYCFTATQPSVYIYLRFVTSESSFFFLRETSQLC